MARWQNWQVEGRFRATATRPQEQAMSRERETDRKRKPFKWPLLGGMRIPSKPSPMRTPIQPAVPGTLCPACRRGIVETDGCENERGQVCECGHCGKVWNGVDR